MLGLGEGLRLGRWSRRGRGVMLDEGYNGYTPRASCHLLVSFPSLSVNLARAYTVFFSGHRVKKFARDWRHWQGMLGHIIFRLFFVFFWVGLGWPFCFPVGDDDVHSICMLGGRLEGLDVGGGYEYNDLIVLIFSCTE